MKDLIPLEFDFRREVLPVLVIGLLLNLAGRYVANTSLHIPFLPSNFLFLDLVGTVVVAVLIGPWWAATVAVLASAVNGVQFTVFFPFGIVGVVLGLTWGYLARVERVRAALSFAPGRTSFRDGLYAFLALMLVGALVAALASVLVKILLYPRMDLPFHLYDAFYMSALEAAKARDMPNPELMSLLGADLLRESADKILTVCLAVPFIILMGFLPTAEDRASVGRRHWPLVDQLKTDAASIFFFAGVYALFLFSARLSKPVLLYVRRGTTYGASFAWLQDPVFLLLLYAPLCLAAVAFLLFALSGESAHAQSVDADRRMRTAIYLRIAGKTGEPSIEKWKIVGVLKKQSVYGLLASVLLWQQSVSSSVVVGLVIYFAVVVVFAVVFFHDRRQFSVRWNTARSQLPIVRQWMRINGSSASADVLVREWGNLLGDDITTQSVPARRGDLSFLPCVLTPQLRRSLDVRHDRAALIVTSPGRAHPQRVAASVSDTIAAAGAHTALVMSTTLDLVEPWSFDWLRDLKSRGCDVVLATWHDFEDTVVGAARREDVAVVLRRCRARMLDKVARRGAAEGETPPSAVALAQRSLPGVAALLRNLPPASVVFDFGAGRGRHAFAAAALGHRVVAVEVKPDVCRSLEEIAAGQPGQQMTVACSRYQDVTLEKLGYADVLLVTGVLQHRRDPAELEADLAHLRSFLGHIHATLYVEMLFDMTFDGQPAADGRYPFSQDEFECALTRLFGEATWRIERVRGPHRATQQFDDGPRSFIPPARTIVSTAVEYMVVRTGQDAGAMRPAP